MKKELAELINLTKRHIDGLRKSGVTEVSAATSLPPAKNTARPPDAGRDKNLEQFCGEIQACKKCSLGKTRTKFVFGDGNPNAELVFIGEAPGYDEDQKGLPFVGRAGQLLTKIIEAMGLKRSDVYICNILKCRPPNNRPPLPEESEKCKPYLIEQLSILKNKKVICCLGLSAAKGLLGVELSMKDMRGNWYECENTPVIVTYHPAYLLRSPGEKRKVWNDMKKVMERLRK